MYINTCYDNSVLRPLVLFFTKNDSCHCPWLQAIDGKNSPPCAPCRRETEGRSQVCPRPAASKMFPKMFHCQAYSGIHHELNLIIKEFLNGLKTPSRFFSNKKHGLGVKPAVFSMFDSQRLAILWFHLLPSQQVVPSVYVLTKKRWHRWLWRNITIIIIIIIPSSAQISYAWKPTAGATIDRPWWMDLWVGWVFLENRGGQKPKMSWEKSTINYKYEKCTIHLTMMEHMKNGFIITFPIETTTSGLLHHFHEHPKSQFVG